MSTPRWRPRAGAYESVWRDLPGRERAKYLFRIARAIQERARELAVLESLDNGKPIRESRDVDIPLAAAHFFYYAGWADKLEHAGFGAAPRPLGVAGQIIPWNFPLLMAAWKLAPALATGNTVVLKPAETTPLTALTLAEIIAECDLPPGVVNVLAGGPAIGQALVEHDGVDKIAFTGSTEVGKLIQRSVAGTPKRLTLELGGKAANIVFDDAPLDQAVEGIVNGIFFNQGHVCCAGSRLLVQESVADEVVAKLQERMATLRLGDPLDKNTDIGAINSAAQLARIRELSDAGEAEGAQRWSPPCELPERGFWFPPTIFTGVSASHRIAREEIFGPVLSVLTFRTPQEAVDKANNTPVRPLGRHLDREGLAHPLDGARAARRRRLGQHVQPLRSGLAVRRLQGIGLRPRGRPARAGGLPCLPLSSRRGDARLRVRKTYKLAIGGAFPRSESGRSYPVEDATGALLANAAQASRKDVRDAVVAARKAFPGWAAATPYNRGQVIYRIAEMLDGRREQFAAEVVAAEGVAADAAQDAVEASIDRIVWYAGWADKFAQVAGSANPIAGPYFNFSLPEPTGVVAILAPQDVEPARLRQRARARALHRQHRRDRRLGAPAAAGGLAGRGARDLGRAGRRRQRADRLSRPSSRRGSRATATSTRSTSRACAAPERAELQRAAADNVKRVFIPSDEDWEREPGLERLTAFVETKTVWHPDRGLSRLSATLTRHSHLARVAICSASGGRAWSTWSVVCVIPKRSPSSRPGAAGSHGSRSRAPRARAP